LALSALLLAGTGPGATARADPLVSGDILVSSIGFGSTPAGVTEYSPAGGRVQTFNIPPQDDGSFRGVTVAPNGNILVYQGTFNPALGIHDPVSGTTTALRFPGWSTVNNIGFGGVAAYQNFAYVTDTFTFGGGEPNGIVRFDTSNGTGQRYAKGNDFIHLTLGKDGLLYGLVGAGSPQGTQVQVFDPITMSLIRSFNTPSLNGLAVDASGHLFAPAFFNPTLYELDAVTGQVLHTYNTGQTYMQSISLSDGGQLVVGSRFGTVLITDTAFSSQQTFETGNPGAPIFVSWVPQPAPEPSTVSLLACGSVCLLTYSYWRRRNFMGFPPRRHQAMVRPRGRHVPACGP
jgi:outer membrane protein assembly factor BamB